MKRFIVICGTLLVFPWLASASPTLISGTPNYFGAGLTPAFGHLINFDDLATEVGNAGGFWQLPAVQYAPQGVASITNSPSATPLYAALFSQQSGPVYLTTGPNDKYAGDITIKLSSLVNAIGIGVSSDNSTPVILKALGATGNVLASFTVTTSSMSSTPANGYWAIRDSSSDLKGIEIISAKNLGIDDLQFAPEPSGFSMLVAGAALAGLALLRRKRQGSN